MEIVKLEGQVRESKGKTANKNLKKSGLVPGIIYGGGKTTSFAIKPLELRSLLYSPDFKLVEINVGGEMNKCILKDAQFHPVTDEVVHIDLLRLVDKHPVKLQVPVRCEGAAPGVKVGGKLQQLMRKISIKTTPENIVDHLTVDISELELGSSVRVKDITVPEGIEIMNPMANPVASIEIPRALRSAQTAEEKEASAADAE